MYIKATDIMFMLLLVVLTFEYVGENYHSNLMKICCNAFVFQKFYFQNLLRLSYTFRGVSRPSDVARLV